MCINYRIGDRVVPIDVQYASQAAMMRGAELSLLPLVEAQSHITVEQHADDTCPINCDFSFVCKRSLLPEPRFQPGKRYGSSSRQFVDPSV